MNIIVLILGLIIGSFLNVCIYRIPKGESIIFPPSYCEKCGVNIKII
ncbi:prepilin peptidase [Clostridium botulinum]|nr:prepilin peptidase [Clostridium botulinum]